MEEQRQKAEEWLKSLTDLSQKICGLWPPGVVRVSAKLRKHLDELNDGLNLFRSLPSLMGEEYKRKAGEVLINSGLIALLCEKVTPWLEDKQGDDVTRVIWALHVCTLGSQILLKKDGDLHRLLPLLMNLLKESFFDHTADTLQQGGDAVLELSLAVLNGLAEVEENKQHIHLPSILSVLKAYSMSENERVYNYAIITMALLETERRADIFSPNHDTVQFLLGQLKALEREGFNPHRKLAGVFGAICVLTQNPGNRELLVQGGVLPYLEKGLAKCVSENNREETATCSNITISLHYLTLAERNKAEIIKHKQLLDSLASIHFDQCHSHHPDCIVVAKCALSNLGMNPQDLSNDGPRRTGEQINNCRKTHAGEARTCRIIFKADGKPAALPSNPESESSGKAKNRTRRTVSSSKSSNKRAKLLPKLETASSDGASNQAAAARKTPTSTPPQFIIMLQKEPPTAVEIKPADPNRNTLLDQLLGDC